MGMAARLYGHSLGLERKTDLPHGPHLLGHRETQVVNAAIVQNGGFISFDLISDYARCRGEGGCPGIISS